MHPPQNLTDRLSTGATVIVAACAVLMAGSTLNDRLRRPPMSELGAREDRAITNWAEIVAEGHRMGPPDATVVIVEFGDYECPFCRKAERSLRALRETYPDQVAVVYRHYPLLQHANAYRAARFAVCAAEQQHFEAVHRLLYNVVTLVDIDANDLASAGGLPDPAAFVRCTNRTAPDARIERDLKAVAELGLHGTPSIIFEGTLLATPPDSAALFQMVRDRIAKGPLAPVSSSVGTPNGSGAMSTREPRSEVTLATHVTAPVTAQETPASWLVDEQPRVSIGGAGGPEEDILYGVFGATVLSDGTIAVGIRSNRVFEVRYYDRGAGFLTSAGRFGDGPFEFTSTLSGLESLGGDSLLVVGADLRFAIYGSRGERITNGRLDIEYPRWPPLSLESIDNRHFALVLNAAHPTSRGGVTGSHVWFQVHDIELGTFPTLGPVPGLGAVLSDDGMYLHLPFEIGATWAVGGGWVWFGNGAERELRGYRVTGSTEGAVVIDRRAEEVTADHQRQWKEFDAALAAGPARAAVERHHRDVPFPDSLPLFAALDVDAAGRVWVLRYEPPWSREDYVWDVYRPDGTRVATARAPFGIMQGALRSPWVSIGSTILEIGEDYVLLLERDTLGIERVRVHALLEAGGSAGASQG